MTVLTIAEQRDSPKENRSRDGRNVGRRITRNFEAITDSVADDANAVLSHDDVPNMTDRYFYRGRYDNRMRVVRVGAVRDPLVPTKWLVSAVYGMVTPDEAEDGEYPQEIDVNWGTEDRVVVATKSSTGGSIVNSAGDPFDPPITDVEHITIVNISRNERDRQEPGTFDDGPYFSTSLQTYKNKTNSTTFLGYPDNSVLCTGMNAQQMEWTPADADADAIRYWRLTYQFKIRHDPSSDHWRAVPLDYGPNRLAGTSTEKGKRIKIKDTDLSTDGSGHEVSAKLDGFGHPLGTALSTLSSTITEVFRDFTIKGEVNFKDLGFDEAKMGVK